MAKALCRSIGIVCALSLCAAGAPSSHADSATYAWTNLAGQPGGWGNVDGMGGTARFYYPCGVAADTLGNVYVADTDNSTIRKITPAGVVTTLAGSAGLTGSDDGTGSAALFSSPYGVAVDGDGNVYVADTGNNTIRKVTPEGLVTTLAGLAGYSGSTDGAAGEARFDNPSGVALDSEGNVYVADTYNNTIRKVTPQGVVTTLAGSAGSSGTADGTSGEAQFNHPLGISVDPDGNVYVADTYNNTIRKVTPEGVVTTLAGSPETFGSADGTGSDALFSSPSGVAVDSTGNVYVVDSDNNTIRKVTPEGVVTTPWGMASTFGSADGTGSAARFNYPCGIAADSTGNLYVADTNNCTIRKAAQAGQVITLAGTANMTGSTDGTGNAALFSNPCGLAVDDQGNVYVADTGNSTIRKVSPEGAVTTLAGQAGYSGSTDGTGSAARFDSPAGIAVDGAGNLYVADTYNNTIRKVTCEGVVTTLAGEPGSRGSADGTGSQAQFDNPVGIATDSDGNVYVADMGNDTIRKITPEGVVTTLAGLAGNFGSADGTGSEAQFEGPVGIAVDVQGNVYVADFYNNTIRKITPDAVVTTLAGQPGISGSTDGTGADARFYYPEGVAVDSQGNVYVAGYGNSTIRKVTPQGVVTTVGGTPGVIGGTDGDGPYASFCSPAAIAADAAGNLYVADSGNNRIAKGTPGAIPPVAPGDPGPANGQLNLPVSSTLSWTDTDQEAVFDVYLDTVNPPQAKVATSLISASFAPSLSLGTRYYWKVVAIDGSSRTDGPVWTFATHLTGDIDGDGAVILADLKLLVAAWNATPASSNWNPDADVDGDGAVILADLKLLVAAWNKSVR